MVVGTASGGGAARCHTEIQFQQAVDAIHAFVVPGDVFDVPHMQRAQPEAPRARRRREPEEPVRDDGVLWCARRRRAIASLADAERRTGVPNRRA